MTIASETSRVDLVGDGANDTFTYTFEIYVKTDILVYVDDVLQTVDVDYTVPAAGIENPDGGDIVFEAGSIPANLAVVSMILNLPFTQLIDYVEGDKFPAETHERGLDRLVKIAQRLKEIIRRQVALIESSQYRDLTLPDPVASKLLAWKDDLTGLKNVEVESEGDLLVTDYIKTLIDDEDAATALITLGLTATAADLDNAILSDGTQGRVLRISQLKIENGTNANTLKCSLTSIWNGDDIAETDNIALNATTGTYWTLNADGSILTIENAGLSGTVIAILGVDIARNQTTKNQTVSANAGTGDISLISYDTATGAAIIWDDEADTGDMYIRILYLTDA